MRIRKLTVDETEWFEKIRMKAVNNAPYLASLMYILRPVMNDDLGTFAVDGKGRLYLSRSGAAANWTNDEYAWALIHECMHVLRDHSTRMGNRDATAWNYAGDLEINDDIATVGTLMPPPGVITPATFGFGNGYAAESYYKRLEKNYGGKPQGQPDDGDGDSSGSGSDSDSKGNSTPESMCSGASKQAEMEADQVDSGRSETEIEAAQESTWISINNEAKMGRGIAPGLANFVADKLNEQPKVDWISVLSSLISRKISEITTGNMDASWRKANRRFDDPILPGRVAYTTDVVVVVDTSGSMGVDLVMKMLNEVQGILNAPGINAKYLFADTEASELQDNIPPKIKITGFGGTHMGYAIDQAVEKYGKKKVDLAIVLTDGYTPWDREYAGPVIAGIVNASDGARNMPAPSDKVTAINIPSE